MAGISLDRIRFATLVAVHVRGVEAEFRGEGGDRAVVGWTRRSTLDPRALRSAVTGASMAAPAGPVADALGFVHGPPRRVTLRGDVGLAPIERGRRWRRRCACATTDYMISDQARDATLGWAHVLLGRVTEPELVVACRRDSQLAATILACRWPGELDAAGRSAFEKGLRDLALVCRVGSEVDHGRTFEPR